VVWWDTNTGAPLQELSAEARGGSLILETPPVASDIAAFAERK
jgi:hypothetical protein